MPTRFEMAGDSPPKGRKWVTRASQQYDEGGLTRFRAAGNGDLSHTVATTEVVLGMNAETKASTDSSTDKILVHIIRGFDEVFANVSTGTMAQTEEGDECDIADEDGVTLTESNNDCDIVAWNGTTDEAYILFRNLVYSGT